MLDGESILNGETRFLLNLLWPFIARVPRIPRQCADDEQRPADNKDVHVSSLSDFRSLRNFGSLRSRI
jgi:hypothetical protein